MASTLTASPDKLTYDVTATLRLRTDGNYDGHVTAARNIFAPADTLVAGDTNKAAAWLFEIAAKAEDFNKARKVDADGRPSDKSIRLFFLFLDADGNAMNNPYKGVE